VFGVGNAPFLSFGKPCDCHSYPWNLAGSLWFKIESGESICFADFKDIPNITQYKLKMYIKAFKESRGLK
jgi:hypothetical protein